MAKTGFTPGRKPITGLLKTPKSTQEIPTPPEGLGQAGLEFWRVIFTRADWLDPELDGPLVEQAARFSDDLKAARDEVAKHGRYFQIPNGSLVRAAAVVDIEKLTISQNAAISALGITPTDRARLGLLVGKHQDELTELEARRIKRQISQI
jgi:hypothetical protein